MSHIDIRDIPATTCRTLVKFDFHVVLGEDGELRRGVEIVLIDDIYDQSKSLSIVCSDVVELNIFGIAESAEIILEAQDRSIDQIFNGRFVVKDIEEEVFFLSANSMSVTENIIRNL